MATCPKIHFPKIDLNIRATWIGGTGYPTRGHRGDRGTPFKACLDVVGF
jgi:hypothetical protein